MEKTIQSVQQKTQQTTPASKVADKPRLSQRDEDLNRALDAVFRVYGRDLGRFFDDVIAKQKAERAKK